VRQHEVNLSHREVLVHDERLEIKTPLGRVNEGNDTSAPFPGARSNPIHPD
jgi:hypothetical protein